MGGRRVTVRLSHAQARELMLAAEATGWQLRTRRRQVLTRSAVAIQEALDAQERRAAEREAQYAAQRDAWAKESAAEEERRRARRARFARFVPGMSPT